MSEGCKKFLLLLLNICSGGVGTIISPFIFEKNCNCRKIICGIIIGCVQILHFVHLLSLTFKFKFINDFYDIIGGENILTPIMSEKYKDFQNEKKKIDDIFEGSFSINPEDIISTKFRISFIKGILIVISSLSYINSCLSPLINLIKDNKIDFKMLTFGVFNPGAGILISSILFFNKNYCNFIISVIGFIIGLLLMLCPYILAIGLYLIKIVYKFINLYIIKLLFIYFGAFGVLYSLIFSFLQKDLNDSSLTYNNSKKLFKGIFDIDCECCSYHYRLKSDFGIATIIRIIANILIPGSGIFSLFYKYGCRPDIFFAGFFMLLDGGGLIILIYSVFYNETDDYRRQLDFEENDDQMWLLILYGYFSGYLLIQICGIIIIILADYFPKEPKYYNGLASLPLGILNILSGGLGTLISMEVNKKYFKNICCDICGKIFLAFNGIAVQHLFIIFMFLDDKVVKIIFIILYCFFVIMNLYFTCDGEKPENEIHFITNYILNEESEENQVNINNNINNIDNNNIEFYRIRDVGFIHFNREFSTNTRINLNN